MDAGGRLVLPVRSLHQDQRARANGHTPPTSGKANKVKAEPSGPTAVPAAPNEGGPINTPKKVENSVPRGRAGLPRRRHTEHSIIAEYIE